MTSTTTRKSLSAAQKRELQEIVSATIVAVLAESGSAKTKGKAKTKKAKATTAKAAPKRTVEGKRCLTSKNRKAFIEAHDWAQPGTSTSALAKAVLVDGQPLTGDWAIGPKRTELVLGKAQPATPKATKKAKVTKKAEPKAAAPKVQPAKAASGQVDLDALAQEPPRRANGTLTPKKEWALREQLALTGQFDRFEIDAKVAEAYNNPGLAEVFGLNN